MADSKTNYLENKILDHVTGRTTYTKPSAVYLGLFTAAPTETTGGTEVTGGSYARQAITFGSAAASGSISSTAIVTFSAMPAATVTYCGVFDASTSGNLLYYKQLPSSITTVAGDDIVFPIGNITITEA